MLLSQSQCSFPLILPSRPPKISSSSSSKRRSMPCHFWWIKSSSSLHARHFRIHNRVKCEASSQRTWNKLDSTVSDDLNEKFCRMNQNNSSQGHQSKLIIGAMSSYCLLRLTQLHFVNTFMKIVQDFIPCVVRTFGATSSPFACISNSLNKPTPLKLDVSLPSSQDIRWSFARLLYLFNIQLERNVATSFIVLLVACFSFVVIGGFLFFKCSFFACSNCYPSCYDPWIRKGISR